jgi:hypothetical protein
VINGSGKSNNSDVAVEFIRFANDIEKAATAVEASPLPDEFADRLRKAYKKT